MGGELVTRREKYRSKSCGLNTRCNLYRCLGLAIAGFVLLASWDQANGLDKPSDQSPDNQWLKEHLLNDQAQLPFSFVYERQASSALLKVWPKKTETRQLDSDRTE